MVTNSHYVGIPFRVAFSLPPKAKTARGYVSSAGVTDDLTLALVASTRLRFGSRNRAAKTTLRHWASCFRSETWDDRRREKPRQMSRPLPSPVESTSDLHVERSKVMGAMPGNARGEAVRNMAPRPPVARGDTRPYTVL